MELLSSSITIAGLVVFETISSIDNAIINADVLSTMGEKARRWFLLWGLLLAVFLVRGLLPWVIVWSVMPGLGPWQAFTATFSSDPKVIEAIGKAAPVLLIGGGVFLVFVFLHWLFLEPKQILLPFERTIQKHGVWFFAIMSVLLALIVWFAVRRQPIMGFSAVIGSTAFFIAQGFKENAARAERELLKGGMSDVSKILYLEVIDATFSIDGVLGAFAFTLSLPLILIGNGIGAIVVREMTCHNVERIKRYIYVKNGAMYSILVLGTVMVLESFAVHVPPWVSPVATFAVVGYCLARSVRAKPDASRG